MPASTSETAARLGSSPSIDSIFSERMAFIGSSPVSRERGCPPHDEIDVAPSVAADFDRIAANMRQCSIIHRKERGRPLQEPFRGLQAQLVAADRGREAD